MEEKIFPLSLAASIVVHGVGIGSMWLAPAKKIVEKPRPKTEVVFQPSSPVKAGNVKPLAHVRKVEKLKIAEKISSRAGGQAPRIVDKRTIPPPAFPSWNTAGKDPASKVLTKQPTRALASQPKRQIVIPVLNSGKITNSKYLAYNDLIRDKIKRRAYDYVDNPKFQSGEVYLTFVVSSDGALQQLKVINNKTAASDFLRSVGVRSIKEASPFPSFPRDLQYPELSFNVVISFKLDE